MKKSVDIKSSFTAADSIPLKVLLDKELMNEVETRGSLLPLHITAVP